MTLLFLSMMAFADTAKFNGPLAKELYMAARRDVFASKPVNARIECTWGMEAGDKSAFCEVSGNKTVSARLSENTSRKLLNHPSFHNFMMEGMCSRSACSFPKAVEVRCGSGECEVLSEIPAQRY